MKRLALVRPFAHRDALDVAIYLADKGPGLDRRFLISFSGTIDWLTENAGAGSPKQILARRLPGLRTWPVSTFENYLIFYRIDGSHIVVLAVLHGSRDATRALRGRS